MKRARAIVADGASAVPRAAVLGGFAALVVAGLLMTVCSYGCGDAGPSVWSTGWVLCVVGAPSSGHPFTLDHAWFVSLGAVAWLLAGGRLPWSPGMRHRYYLSMMFGLLAGLALLVVLDLVMGLAVRSTTALEMQCIAVVVAAAMAVVSLGHALYLYERALGLHDALLAKPGAAEVARTTRWLWVALLCGMAFVAVATLAEIAVHAGSSGPTRRAVAFVSFWAALGLHAMLWGAATVHTQVLRPLLLACPSQCQAYDE